MSSSSSSASTMGASSDEFSSYRAISILAVASFTLGLLSILSFAPWRILVWTIPPAAVLSGVLALRQIRAAPEEWAGTRFAQAGIGLAVMCWLTALSWNGYTTAWMKRHGRSAADRFLGKLKNEDLESAFWLTVPPGLRPEFGNMTVLNMPEAVLEQYMRFRVRSQGLAHALASGASTAEFETVEDTAHLSGTDRAVVVYKLHAPDKERHLMVMTLTPPSTATFEKNWYVLEYEEDYTPHSYDLRPTTGHGHAH